MWYCSKDSTIMKCIKLKTAVKYCNTDWTLAAVSPSHPPRRGQTVTTMQKHMQKSHWVSVVWKLLHTVHFKTSCKIKLQNKTATQNKIASLAQIAMLYKEDDYTQTFSFFLSFFCSGQNNSVSLRHYNVNLLSSHMTEYYLTHLQPRPNDAFLILSARCRRKTEPVSLSICFKMSQRVV